MISPQDATDRITSHLPLFPVRTISSDQAAGEVLRESIVAQRDAPPFDRVMLDGIAVSFEALQSGQKKFRIEGSAPAGSEQKKLLDPTAALEVMTGSMLPLQTDTVIPVEDLADGEKGWATVSGEVGCGQGVHLRGSSVNKGVEILSPGLQLGPAALAVIATEGLLQVKVSSRPKIGLLTTGDEIIPPDQDPLPHQIRASHPSAFKALFENFGYSLHAHIHVDDLEEDITRAIRNLLEKSDVLVVTGGVSKGKRDFVPELLSAAGVDIAIHGVSQRPGKPFLFGHKDQQLIFALPGNPMSALLCARRYVIPALDQASGAEDLCPERIHLDDEIFSHPVLTTFQEVTRSAEGWKLCRSQNSGDLHAPAASLGMIECPPRNAKTSSFDYYAWSHR